MTDETHHSKGPLLRLIGLLIILALIGLFIYLGLWQLGRADEKRQTLKNTLQASQQAVLGVESLKLPLDALKYRQVRLRGEFEQEQLILLDNRKYQDRAGYQVITPLHITGTDYRVLVNRGWVAQGPMGRAQLPVIATPRGEVEVSGQIVIPTGKGFRPGISAPGDAQGGVWIYLDVEYWAAAVDYPVAGFLIQQDRDDEHGFVREWPVPEYDDGMHLAYAAQWFAFAGFLIMGLCWNLITVFKQRKSGGELNE